MREVPLYDAGSRGAFKKLEGVGTGWTGQGGAEVPSLLLLLYYSQA